MLVPFFADVSMKSILFAFAKSWASFVVTCRLLSYGLLVFEVCLVSDHQQNDVVFARRQRVDQPPRQCLESFSFGDVIDKHRSDRSG